jgi:hypothetical protein
MGRRGPMKLGRNLFSDDSVRRRHSLLFFRCLPPTTVRRRREFAGFFCFSVSFLLPFHAYLGSLAVLRTRPAQHVLLNKDLPAELFALLMNSLTMYLTQGCLTVSRELPSLSCYSLRKLSTLPTSCCVHKLPSCRVHQSCPVQVSTKAVHPS